MTKALFSIIFNVSKERGIKKWNVLIAMESAEHTLNALNVERENKMEKKNVPQRIKDIAKELEELSAEVWRDRHSNEDWRKSLAKDLSDELFSIQSKLNYTCLWKAQDLYDE